MAERRPVSPPPEHHEEPVFRDEMYVSGIFNFKFFLVLTSLLLFIQLKLTEQQVKYIGKLGR